MQPGQTKDQPLGGTGVAGERRLKNQETFTRLRQSQGDAPRASRPSAAMSVEVSGMAVRLKVLPGLFRP
jgi:hypothetical protein